MGLTNIATLTSDSKVKILFLGANPFDTTRLALDREVREITQRLRATPCAERFELVQEWALRVGDIQAALLRHKPQIVHFSGHGSGAGRRGKGSDTGTIREFLPDVEVPEYDDSGIWVENDVGKAVSLAASALADLFKIVGGVRCVVLNACHSAAQADTIRQHVDCVVGMGRAIQDQSAIAFAWSFYQGLGFGKPITKAFELGRNQIRLEGFTDVDVPQLLVRETASGSGLDHLALVENGFSLPRASDDEILILIAQFDAADSHRIHVEERIHRAFSRMREMMSDLPLRFERLRDITIKDGDELRATTILTQCNARLLIWGWYDQVGFSPRLAVDSSAAIESEIPAFDEIFRDDSDARFRKFIFSGLADNLQIWALAVAGELLYWSGRVDDCLKLVDIAIEQWRRGYALQQERDAFLDSRIATTFFYKGVLMGTRKRNVGAAADCFREVLELKPKSIVAAYNLGDALYNLADYEGAVRAFTKVIDAVGSDHRSLVGRGHSYSQLQRYREAIEDYTSALGLVTTPDIFLARSMAYHELGLQRLAFGDYVLARDLDPYGNLQADHLEKHLLRTRGKDAYERAQFGPVPGVALTGGDKYKMPQVTQFLGTARRFLGRSPPPLGTCSIVADPIANEIARALASIDEGPSHEGTLTAREDALCQSGEQFLEAFSQGFPNPRTALMTVVTMLRCGGPEWSLESLLAISEVRSRLQPQLLSAIELLLRTRKTYLHAAAIIGGDPVLWRDNEAILVPLCTELCRYLDALNDEDENARERRQCRENFETNDDYFDDVEGDDDYDFDDDDDYDDESFIDFKPRGTTKAQVIRQLFLGLAERHKETLSWTNLSHIARAASLARDSRTLTQGIDDLFCFLEANAVVSPNVRNVVVEILQGHRPFLLEAINLRCSGNHWNPLDTDGLLELNGIADAFASIASISEDMHLPEQTRAAASVILKAMLNEDRYWERAPELASACMRLKSEPATTGLFATIIGCPPIASRLKTMMRR